MNDFETRDRMERKLKIGFSVLKRCHKILPESYIKETLSRNDMRDIPVNLRHVKLSFLFLH